MEIKDHIKDTHERLSKTNTRFLEFIRQNPSRMRAEHYHLLELNDPLFKLQPWPTFIGQQTKNQVKEASLKVLDLLKALPQRIFSNDIEKISQYYGVSLDLAKYFLNGVTDEHYNNLLARGDFTFTDSGLKCLEYNINTNLGGMNLPLWESLYLATPVISEFITQNRVKIYNRNLYSYLFEHLAIRAKAFYNHCEKINIAIIMPQMLNDPIMHSQERYLHSVYREVMETTFNGLPGQAFICKFPQLRVKGDEVYYNNKKLHFLVEWCQGYVPKEILKIFKQGKLLICNGAVAWLLSTKLNLALLSEMEDAELFSPEEKETIKKYIPWTRKIAPGETTYKGQTVQLKEFMLSNREKLVLKPLLGAGGKDIYIGPYTPEEEWKQVVESAMTWNDWQDIHFGDHLTEMQWYDIAKKAFQVKNWLVQEYIEPPTYLYQLGENGYAEHHAVWGFFIFGDIYAGGWVRVIPVKNQSGIINCHQGARVSVAFEVDE